MIALNDISYEFGGNYLYKNANWHIKPKERIGLVGKNGTGKTTLLRLITGEYELTRRDNFQNQITQSRLPAPGDVRNRC